MNPETILALLRLIIMDPADIVLPNPSQYYELYCESYYHAECGNLDEMEDASPEVELNPGLIIS